MVQAWRTAWLHRIHYKKFPKDLDQLLGKRDIKQQTPEEMRKVLLGFNRHAQPDSNGAAGQN